MNHLFLVRSEFLRKKKSVIRIFYLGFFVHPNLVFFVSFPTFGLFLLFFHGILVAGGSNLCICTRNPKKKIIRLLMWSALLGVIAGGLCGFSKNDGWIPVNKNLWSLSFILTTACFAMFLLAVLYFLIDVVNIWTGTPFHYPSVNSIVRTNLSIQTLVF